MTARPVQYFTDEYLERCRSMTPDQICRFVDDFRRMVFEASGGRDGEPTLPREREATPPEDAGPATRGPSTR